MDTKSLKQTAKEFLVDDVGIAPIERFDVLPPEKNPKSIFPECQSVIVLSKRILRGALRGVEEGTNFNSTYSFFGANLLENDFLAMVTYDLTCWIESQGYEAVPLFGYANDADMAFGVPVAPGKPVPNVVVDQNFAAQAAGVAAIGKGGFSLSPEYGPRQRFAMILTDCKLEADPVIKNTTCDGCNACIVGCPLGAYKKNTVKLGVSGSECEVAELDLTVCKVCQNGAQVQGGRGGAVDRLAASCARACIVRLEKDKLCGNKFKNEFRKREPWALDPQRKIISCGVNVNVGGQVNRES